MNYIEHVKRSISQATAEKSKLDGDVLKIPGMSSKKSRHLLNNLCNFPEAVYLEIGSWKGSTIISAAFRNPGKFYAMDHFKKNFKVENPKTEFYRNKVSFKSDADFKFFECDSWKFDLSKISEKVNVYFYDGDHSPEGTEKAFTYYDPVFADQFIMIMDDWNRRHIREATEKALEKYDVLFSEFLRTPRGRNDDHGESGFGSMDGRTQETWWNGLYVTVLEKK